MCNVRTLWRFLDGDYISSVSSAMLLCVTFDTGLFTVNVNKFRFLLSNFRVFIFFLLNVYSWKEKSTPPPYILMLMLDVVLVLMFSLTSSVSWQAVHAELMLKLLSRQRFVSHVTFFPQKDIKCTHVMILKVCLIAAFFVSQYLTGRWPRSANNNL